MMRGRLLRRRPLREQQLGRQELVGLPCALVVARVRAGGAERPVRCLVDGIGGGAVWVEGAVEASIEASLRSPKPTDPDLVRLPAVLEMERCVQDGTELVARRLSVVGRGTKWELVGPVVARPLLYPYWVLYFERRGRWDLRAVDAIGGEAVGGIVRRSLIAGLVELDRGVGGLPVAT